MNAVVGRDIYARDCVGAGCPEWSWPACDDATAPATRIARVKVALQRLFESDEAALELNGAVLTQDVVHTTWKDPRIFSWDAPPFTVTPVAMVKNLAAQKLTRLVLLVPADILKRGDNSIVLSVNRECSSHLPNNLR